MSDLTMNFPEYNQIVKSLMRADTLLAGQRKALELLAKRAPLIEILHHLVALIEGQYDGLLCSILLVDDETKTFKAGVDVSTSKNYSLEDSGVSILPPYVGPCCRAANLGELVVSEDIANDPAWQDKWKNWAINNGLKSCRSHPIFSSTGAVIATFAMYHRDHHDPVLSSMYQIELTTHIAGIAIERKNIESREAEWREKMQQINCELSQAVKMRDELLSIASHELNSPLATMKMWTAMEKECLIDGERLDRENIINLLDSHEAQIDRIIKLVRTLTDASYLTGGPGAVKPSPMDLVTLAEDCVDKLRPMAEQAHCHLKFTAPDPVFGNWDQIRLEQVFTNLITNAIKYGGGSIRVGISRGSKAARITVEDNGMGISPTNHEKIFQRYERVGPNVSSIKGHGLGLYIVREIVTAHGGSVHVESEIGRGAKFIVELPCADVPKAPKRLLPSKLRHRRFRPGLNDACNVSSRPLG